MTLLLVLAICCQDDRPAVPTRRADLEFGRAVEESVMAMRPDAAPPRRFAEAFRLMGAPDWRTRERAQRAADAAVAAEPGDARWLFWGMRSRDPEVAIRCLAALRRASVCRSCKGDGTSRQWSSWPCGECEGESSYYPRSTWD